MVVLVWSDNGRQGDRGERVCDWLLQKELSARTIALLMTTARDQLSKTDTITIAAIEAGVPALIEARNLIDRFRTMIRRRPRPNSARGSLTYVACSPSLCQRDPERQGSGVCSNVEGQINKLKLVRRQMYACQAASSLGTIDRRDVKETSSNMRETTKLTPVAG
nr:hypothetical protein [Rhizobium multihospitium]